MPGGRWRAAWDSWIELILWVSLAAVACFLTFEFDEPLDVYRFGAASWPRVVIGAVAAAAVIQFVLATRRPRHLNSESLQSYWARLKRSGLAVNLKLLATFVVPLVYVYLLPRAGFYAMTPLFISGYMYLLGERRLIHLIGTSMFIYGLGLLIFAKLLFVALPVGNWPGFYHFSNWLLVLIR